MTVEMAVLGCFLRADFEAFRVSARFFTNLGNSFPKNADHPRN